MLGIINRQKVTNNAASILIVEDEDGGALVDGELAG